MSSGDRSVLFGTEDMRVFSGPTLNIHTDDATARAANMPGVIVQGVQLVPFILGFVRDVLDDAGAALELKVRFVRPIVPAVEVRAVAEREVGESAIGVELWQRGAIVALATATTRARSASGSVAR